ncbi:transmembrane protein 234 homolog [Pectinophora gossypiella]|uniref:transmembrane protein 234 homolog n=1 Tax=Pectinophora gossypiella TaxID=13191 RepID=UPI00214E8DC1|nr:transmembrane protein 234 homolog [Pectinophora gossypiella]
MYRLFMFSDVPVGLIVLTGALWGCTNPFIRQGTRGLRDVRAKTRLGQAYAEVAFLLGNWRAGSIAYLFAVRCAPLSLCVPAANALAFAFTALTGAAFGKEEPLDRGSMLGIALIVAGTALCCWDKTE